MDYDEYVIKKLSRVPPTGIPQASKMPTHGMFDFQRALTSWALRRGRAAIFADTGLGKSRMQLAWADAVRKYTKKPVLILAPLAVAPQTVKEGAEIDVGYLSRLRAYANVNPGRDKLRRLGLRRVVAYELLKTPNADVTGLAPAQGEK